MERNRDLFWKLLEPDHPKAEAFCCKLMGNREDGDDLYQDALVLAITKFSSLNETTAFRPWLYRIIVNSFKNRFRTPWYRKVIPMTEEISQSLRTSNPTHDYAVGRLVRKALSAISSEERALVTLFELEGWTVNELCGLYQRPEGTIKARLSRARKKMKKALLKGTHTSSEPSKLNQEYVSKSKILDSISLKSISDSPSVSQSTVSRTYQK